MAIRLLQKGGGEERRNRRIEGDYSFSRTPAGMNIVKHTISGGRLNHYHGLQIITVLQKIGKAANQRIKQPSTSKVSVLVNASRATHRTWRYRTRESESKELRVIKRRLSAQ